MSASTSLSRPRRTALPTAAAALLAGSLVAAVPAIATADDAAPGTVADMVLDAHGEAIITQLEHTEVAPGLDHVSFERLESEGWLRVNVLKAELSESAVRADYIGPETLTEGATVTEMAEDAGAIAAVNGDFFDINNSWAPSGTAISAGEGLLKSANPGRHRSVAFDDAGLGRITELLLEGTVDLPDATVPLDGINLYAMPAGGVAVYTSAWGDFSRGRAVPGDETGVEVQVDAAGEVTAVGTPGGGRLAEDTLAVVARPGEAADALAGLTAGDPVSVAYSLNEDDVQVAIGGQPSSEPPILDDGVVPPPPNEDVHPRTAIGFSEDGATGYFVVVDGRQATSRGLALDELGQLLLDLGAHDALNVDGGGSSQMNVRAPGAEVTSVRNSPADGEERVDSNGLGLFLAAPGSGELAGFRLDPATGEASADRVFPGLSRTLDAHGHDESSSPVPGEPAGWSSDDESATVSDGVVTGQAPGSATITAATGEATGELGIDVLGPLERLSTAENVMNFEAAGTTAELVLLGHDAEGFVAPVEARDVEVRNPDPGSFAVDDAEDGSFLVTAVGEEASTIVTFAVDDAELEVALNVPLEQQVVADFADAAEWTSEHDRAPDGTVAPGEGHDGGDGLHMTYDFTQSTGTRGQYAVAPDGGIEIPGSPQKISLWVNGDGNGSLLRLQVRQANGIVDWIDGPGGSQSLLVDWEGWEQVDFIVPAAFQTPLTLERIRVLETVAANQYTGELGFSDMVAYLPPEDAAAPAEERVTDRLVVPTGATADSELRVAVMSDAQFVARDPESGAVDGARSAFREIMVQDPDVLIINGDLVDEAAPEDFDLARQIIDEELGDAPFPWYYVPGNHEIMGGPIDNFIDEFGETSHVFDMESTRVITLNSATGRLADDFEQVQLLQEQLDDAADDDAITGVLVASHMPPNDPLPTKNSQLTDRLEAETITRWLGEWRSESGKSVAYLAGHVGAFHTERLDGVPYVINGNSGKNPASVPELGGFTGWTMIGIDPAAGHWAQAEDEWLSVETQTRVDELALTGPSQPLAAGERVALEAQITQDDDRTFDLAWPMSWAWSGSSEVFVGAVSEAPGDAIVALDPQTGVVTALRSGAGEITLAAGTAEETVPIEVTGGHVAIGGEPVVGHELAADLSGWGLSDEATVEYQWLRDGEAVPGADGDTYLLGVDDLDAEIAIEVTVAAPDRETLTAQSEVVGPVTPGQLPDDIEATLAGRAEVGQSLEVTVSGVDALDVELAYEWLRNDEEIETVGASHLLDEADVGARMQVVVTVSADGYEPVTVLSNQSDIVREAPEEPTEEPTDEPTEEPTDEPTEEPTEEPTDGPGGPGDGPGGPDDGDGPGTDDPDTDGPGDDGDGPDTSGPGADGPGSDGGDLPSTGADPGALAAVALVALLVGTATAALRRRSTD